LQHLAVAELERTGAHDAHLAAEDVDELRELVQAGLAEESAQRGHPGVVLHLEQDAAGGLVLPLQLAELLLGVDDHRPELEDPEQPAAMAAAELAEEDRARRIQADQDRDHDHHGGQQQEADEGPAEVHGPLGRKPQGLGQGGPLGTEEVGGGELELVLGRDHRRSIRLRGKGRRRWRRRGVHRCGLSVGG